MKSNAMKNIISKIKNEINLYEVTALEFFAREGDWQTQDYAEFVKELHAWEIDPQFENNLRRNVPKAKVRIGDSYQMAKEKEFNSIFDMIILDNPQNVFGQYCEHFEALPLIKDLFKSKDKLTLIFNINKKPFNYESQAAWQLRRNEYYEVSDSSNFDLDFLDSFYRKKIESLGLKVIKTFNEARDANYLYYKVFILSKA
jgi:hypothetical protein